MRILQVPILGGLASTLMLPISTYARSRTQKMKFWLGDALPRDRSADKFEKCCHVDVHIFQVLIRGEVRSAPILPMGNHARSRTQM